MSSEDVMIKAKLNDEVSSGLDKISSKFKNMSSDTKKYVGAAMTAVSGAALAFSKTAIDSAMNAEVEWTRFGAAVDASGGNWDKQSAEVKKWVRDFSDSMGRATSDTRAAMTNFMNYGMSLEQSQNAMKATAGVAAATGMTEEEASNAVIQACNGRGMALKKLGINMDDYKDKATGAINKEKLLNDLQARFGDSASKYANTAAGKFQTLQNTIASLKTEFGASLMDALTPLIPVVKSILDAFNGLPGPVKTGVFLIVGLGAAIGVLAGPIMSVIGLLESLGIIGPLAGAGAAEAGAGAAAGSAGVFTLGAAVEFLLSPITLIVLAILALIAVIYLVGQYFGLWNNPMEMCQVILGALWSALQQVASFLMGAFMNAWNTIISVINTVKMILTTLWNALLGIATGQVTISSIIMTVWQGILARFGQILTRLLIRVVTFAASFVAYAVNMARRFVTAVIGGITSLPSRVWGIFTRVIQMIQNAVSAAGQAASNVAQAIWDGLTGILGGAASWINDNLVGPLKDAWNLVTGGGAAGSRDLPTTALEAGTYIGSGYLGKGVNSTVNNKTNKSVVNVNEINLKLDNVNDQQAKRILVQALEGLEQVREVRTV